MLPMLWYTAIAIAPVPVAAGRAVLLEDVEEEEELEEAEEVKPKPKKQEGKKGAEKKEPRRGASLLPQHRLPLRQLLKRLKRRHLLGPEARELLQDLLPRRLEQR